MMASYNISNDLTQIEIYQGCKLVIETSFTEKWIEILI